MKQPIQHKREEINQHTSSTTTRVSVVKMGGGRKSKGSYRNRKKKKQQHRDAYDNSASKAPYRVDFTEKTLEQGNYKFEAYYALQGMYDHRMEERDGKSVLVPCETDEEKNAERLRWRSSVASILPASFRTAYDVSEALKEKLETELEELIKEQKTGAAATAAAAAQEGDAPAAVATTTPPVSTENKEIMKKLSFLPHAYQLYTDRKFIRKDASMKKLHLWLRQQTDAGFITRQETVSMVPPVVLDPQPKDLVLDMCAAPGSKSCQILEKLDVDGAMIANDSSSQRAYMLVHQLRRIMHNNPVVMVTSCDAQFFPQTLSFDRILADVPCSGDGTTRKNIGIWKNWNQLGALALHNLQLDIAWKGVALLKVGGYMCYSTCSHNPIENEAVVAELLRRSNGNLELVDAPLEGFKVRPGVHSWKVLAEEKSNRQMKNEKKKNNAKMRERKAEFEQKEQEKVAADVGDNVEDSADKTKNEDDAAAMDAPDTNGEEKNDKGDTEEKEEFVRPKFVAPASWDEETLLEIAKDSGLVTYKTLEEVPSNLQKRIKSSCFPPTKEEIEKFHLEKCIRCLSHDNDTGGFFVALLKKTAPTSRREIKQINRSEEAQESENIADDGPLSKKMKPNEDEVDVEKVAADTAEAMEEENVEDASTEVDTNQQEKQSTDLGRDDFVAVDPALFDPMIEFYGFTDDFPKEQYMARSSGNAKIIFYLGKAVKDNFIDNGLQERVTIIGSGVRGFIRNTNMDTDTPYRISQEGAHFLIPYMTKRKVIVGKDDFLACMIGEGKVIPLPTFSEEFINNVSPLSSGPFVVMLRGFENDLSHKLILVMWRCRSDAVNCLVNKVEISGMQTKVASLE